MIGIIVDETIFMRSPARIEPATSGYRVRAGGPLNIDLHPSRPKCRTVTFNIKVTISFYFK